MQPLVRSVLDGFNVCIFAYGQTGSGKTFTMVLSLSIAVFYMSNDLFLQYKNIVLWMVQSGPKVLTEECLGVNYRALNDLFSIQEQRKDTICYEISVQMIEIYNEQVRDLLQNGGNKKYPFLMSLIFIYFFNYLNYFSAYFFWGTSAYI